MLKRLNHVDKQEHVELRGERFANAFVSVAVAVCVEKRIRAENRAELNDPPEDLYRTNIQIAELNAMNASLAMVRYKQLRGFYASDEARYHLLMNIRSLKIAGESLD